MAEASGREQRGDEDANVAQHFQRGMWLGMLHGDCCLEAETQQVEGRHLKTYQVDKTICESQVLPPKHFHTQNTTWATHPSTTVDLDLVAGPAQGTLLESWWQSWGG